MSGFFYALHQALHLCQSLEAMVGTTKWIYLKKNPITTRSEKYTKESVYWKSLYDFLSVIYPVLQLLQIANSNKPGMDCIYHLSYKANCEIEKSKETLDDVIVFVRSLISDDDEAYATYSDSESEDGNEDTLEQEYDDDKEDIFDYLQYDSSDSGEEEDKQDAIDSQFYLTKFYVILKKGE